MYWSLKPLYWHLKPPFLYKTHLADENIIRGDDYNAALHVVEKWIMSSEGIYMRCYVKMSDWMWLWYDTDDDDNDDNQEFWSYNNDEHDDDDDCYVMMILMISWSWW